MTRRFSLFLLAVAACGQIAAPRIGYVVDSKHALRPVFGVAGAFLLGSVITEDVVSAAYSGKCLVVKKAQQLAVENEIFEAPEGPAEITFYPDGSVHQVFFSLTGELWTWNEGRVEKSRAASVLTAESIVDGELFVRGIPVRLRSRAERVSHLGKGWLVVYAADSSFAIHGESVYELPEDAAE